MSKKDKELTAHHESGHAILALFIKGADPLHKVTILPRGMAGGYTIQIPIEDKYYYSKQDLLVKIICSMGGRVAEEIMFNEITTGASQDLKEATELSRKMVMRFGMSDKLGHLTFGRREEQVFLGRDIVEEQNYSEQTAQLIDQEVRNIVDGCYIKAKEELIKHKDQLKMLAEKLLDKEVMDVEEVRALLGLSGDTATTVA
jgi:cell division protease FtsH